MASSGACRSLTLDGILQPGWAPDGRWALVTPERFCLGRFLLCLCIVYCYFGNWPRTCLWSRNVCFPCVFNVEHVNTALNACLFYGIVPLRVRVVELGLDFAIRRQLISSRM